MSDLNALIVGQAALGILPAAGVASESKGEGRGLRAPAVATQLEGGCFRGLRAMGKGVVGRTLKGQEKARRDAGSRGRGCGRAICSVWCRKPGQKPKAAHKSGTVNCTNFASINGANNKKNGVSRKRRTRDSSPATCMAGWSAGCTSATTYGTLKSQGSQLLCCRSAVSEGERELQAPPALR